IMLIMHRQVLILAGSQALFQSISVLILTIGGLAGALLTPSLSLIVTNGAIVIHTQRLKSDPGGNLLS
ncbi:hypothetical protein, partial [Salmonella enterica]|uniref:hypothetical protein n=1 Tax=Salmonella enterica TaxID=28901 RepID=UPI001BAFA238